MDENPDIKNITTPAQRLRRMAENVSALEVDPQISAVMYFRSGIQMVRMADMHLKQGSLIEAYMLYLRFMTLFLEKIREHPGWSLLPANDRKLASEKVKQVLPKTEKLKEQLRIQFEEDYRKKVERILTEEQKRKAAAAEQEARQRELERQKQKQPRPPNDTTPIRFDRVVSDVVTDPIVTLDSIVYPDADNTLSPKGRLIQPSAPSPDPDSYSYPRVPTVIDNQSDKAGRLPSVDRSTKPGSLLSISAQSSYGLRNVVVPSQLVERFLVLAHGTTVQNIETCGILAGYLDQNQLVISHLIVPKQNATPDSCTTENEEEVFLYQDKHNVITLGWIHTHPSQTAFLSSVDMHTHCSYQLMMPEAIAIVCAPRYKDNSIFCLTQHYGLDFIAKCTKTGFHPHPSEPPLFTIAEHARLESDLPVEVIDMRR